jgi:hypothetical protein
MFMNGQCYGIVDEFDVVDLDTSYGRKRCVKPFFLHNQMTAP